MRTLLIVLAILIGAWAIGVFALVLAGRRTTAKELATFVPNLVILFRGLLGDPEVPRRVKLWLGIGIVWIASPLDLIPEFIPVAGPLDDAIVAALVLRAVVRRSGAEAVRRHWRGGEGSLGVVLRLAGEPKRPT